MLYRVRDWGKIYENSETRKLKKLSWVPVPNKHDGKTYQRLRKLPGAPRMFCGWVLILQIASKCPIRGTLADEDGPLTAEDLSDKTGYPADIFEETLQTLADPRIGWLEIIDEIPQSPETSGDAPEMSVLKGTEQKGTEGKGREGEPPPHQKSGQQGSESVGTLSGNGSTQNNGSTLAARIEHEKNFKAYFWDDYPKKHGYDAALRIWVQLNPILELMEEIHEKVRLYARKCDRRENGRFILNPDSWLVGRRWMDQVIVEKSAIDVVGLAESVKRNPIIIEEG